MEQLILELAPSPLPTFDSFAPGVNRAAVAALRALASGGGSDRSIYLWGEPGSGRSHLLEATVHAMRERGCIALLLRSGHELERASADAGLIAIDDIDSLDAGEQISAFDLFNSILARGAALVAAGSAPPQRLAVREDLRTRLASGLAFELTPLSDAEKRATLRRHAAARGMALTDDVLSYLLTRLRRDLGTQLAVLDALDRYSLAQKRAVTLPLVRDALDALDLQRPQRPDSTRR